MGTNLLIPFQRWPPVLQIHDDDGDDDDEDDDGDDDYDDDDSVRSLSEEDDDDLKVRRLNQTWNTLLKQLDVSCLSCAILWNTVQNIFPWSCLKTLREEEW